MRNNVRVSFCAMSAAIVGIAISASEVQGQAGRRGGDADPFGGAVQAEPETEEIRVYPVADLLITPPNYQFPGRTVPTTDMQGGLPASGFGGGSFGGSGLGGGGLGGGGMGGMGGGFFQMGEGSATTAQNGGMGGALFSLSSQPAVNLGSILRIDGDTLIDTIQTVVAPSSWDSVGGSGTLSLIAGNLVVAQTPSNHKQIENLLSELAATSVFANNVNVHATWLLLSETQISGLKGESTDISRDALAALVGNDEVPQAHARLQCFSGQTVYTASGLRSSTVTGVTPVVGGSSAAYQPAISIPNLGTVLQLTPIAMGQQKSIVLDVQSLVTSRNSDDVPSTVIAFHEGSVDATGVNMHAHQFATTVRCRPNQPLIAGAMTVVADGIGLPSATASETNQLVLILEVTK